MTNSMTIVGAGPIGLEAALCAAQRGWDVCVYDAGEVGEHVRRWGHVTFFSPWSLNMGPEGRKLLGELSELPPEDEFPTGAQFVERYLVPLSRHPLLKGCIHTGTRVEGIARAHALKGDYVGSAQRAAGPFVLSVRGPKGLRFEHADVVLDTSGAYSIPNHLGPGGLPVPGSQELSGRMVHWVPDILGKKRATYANRLTMVVGSGYSAVTSVADLLELRKNAPDTQVLWLMRETRAPYTVLEDDALPQRAQLAALGQRAAHGDVPGVEVVLGAQITSMHHTPQNNRVHVDVTTQEGDDTFQVQRVISAIGYRPDTDLTRELQVHLCYATEGPMTLAAALMAAGGGGGDCLAQTGQGVQTLMTPEPNFYVLGAKSYGRNSAFLLKIGYEQAHDLMAHITEQNSNKSDT